MKFSFSVFPVMLFMVFGFTSCAQEIKSAKALKIYKSANYEVKSYDYEGLEALMSVANDTTYVYNFWATWCAPCVKELPSFLKLQEAYKDKPFKLILVSLDFSKSVEKSLLPFLEKKKMNVEVILLNDPDVNSWIEKVDKDWSGAIPATLIVNKNMRKFYEQSFEYEELEEEVKSFIN